MKHILLLFNILLISTLILSQQQVIYNVTNSETFVAKYSSGIESRNKNHILKVIAASIPKHVNNTQFVISYKQKLKIERRLTKLFFGVDLTEIQFSGDVYYKGFPMNEVLFPATIDIKINWIANNTILGTYQFNDIELEGNPINIISMNVVDTFNLSNYQLNCTYKKLKYTHESVNTFNSKCVLIDDYYNFDTQMKIAFIDLQKVNLNDLDRIFEYKNLTDRNAHIIKNINDKDIINKLELNLFDPIDFEQKYSDLHQLNSKISVEINNILQNLHQIYYTKGLEFLSENNIELASLYFNKSINSNLMFAPAHYQLAKIDFHKNDISQAVQRIKDILIRMQADPNTQNLTIELAKNIYTDQINEAAKHNANGRYNNAIDLLKNAENICISISGVYCNEDLKDEFSKSYNGKLNKYITKAETLIKAKAFKDAESIISTAKIFIQNHNTFLNINLLNNIKLMLYEAYFNYGKLLNTTGKYDKALIQFQNAENICACNSFIECSNNLNKGIYAAKYGIYLNKIKLARQALDDDNNHKKAEDLLKNAKIYQQKNNLEIDTLAIKLLNDIKLVFYTNAINNGKKLSDSKKHKEALNSYNTAKQLENNYSFNKDANLSSYIENSARALIFSETKKGNVEVEKNHIENAKKYFFNSQELQTQYNLNNHKDISNAINELRDKIFSQECKNAQSDYDKKYNKAIEFIGEQRYIDAEKSLDDALKISDNNSDCRMSTDNVINKKNEILAGIIYQKKIVKINELICVGRYKEVITNYNEAEQYFNGNNVSHLRLKHTILFDFIKSNKDLRFINYSVGYYSGNSEFDKSLELLDELKRKDYQVNITKDNQIFLGTKLAIKDHKQNPKIIAKNNVINYTKGDKWYKYLKKAYIKQWKQL